MRAAIFILLITLSTFGNIDKEPQSDKILFVVSNAHYYGNSDIHTANHFPEIVFAYDVFQKAGYRIDFVSPKGGAIPLGYIYSDTLLMRYLYDKEFMTQLKTTRKPDDIDPEQYQAIFYAGGAAAMFEVPNHKSLQEIAVTIYENNSGIISAVCHGTAGIANIKKSDGSFLVSGKRINGFPDAFENKEAEYFQQFPFSIEDQVKANGGVFSYSEEGWDSYLEVDGRVITGQDPTSSALVAEAVIKAIENK